MKVLELRFLIQLVAKEAVHARVTNRGESLSIFLLGGLVPLFKAAFNEDVTTLEPHVEV